MSRYNGGPGGGGGGGLASIPTAKTLWVDAVNGGAGTTGRQDLPFATIAGAIAAAVSGDLIQLRPGTYAESGLTLPDGVVLAGESWQNTSVGAAAAVADVLTMGAGCGISGITVIVPTAAHAGIRHSAGTGSLFGVNIQGDGATGGGAGIRKDGTGKLIGGMVRNETGGLASYLRVDAGVLALDDVHCPQSAGTIGAVLLAAGGTFQSQGFNVGNTNVVDALSVGGTATVRLYSPNIFNVANSVHITADGPSVTVSGGKISATLRTVWVDPALTGTGTTVRVAGCVLDPLFDFPSAAAGNTDFALSFNQAEGPTRDSRQRLIGSDMALGFPELGSGLSIGMGAAYGDGIHVVTTDGTETMVGSVVTGGNQTDVTVAAASRSASTFTFQGLATNHAIYIASKRKTPAGAELAHFGWLLNQVAAGVGGSYIAEVWDGAAWSEVGTMAVSEAEQYRYGNALCLRAASTETVHLGITGDTTQALSTVIGHAAYHVRLRVASTLTTAPTWERLRLIESSTTINARGQRTATGLAKWRSVVSAAGLRWSGSGTANGSVTMGTGAVGWNHELDGGLLNGANDDAYLQLLLPQGICTAHPLTLNVLYGYQNVGGTGTGAPSLQLDVVVAEVAGNTVADAGGALVPIARTAALTATTDSAAGTRASWTGEVLPVSKIARFTTPEIPISAYYEGDFVAMRFTLIADSGGTDVLIYALSVEGIQFADGAIE